MLHAPVLTHLMALAALALPVQARRVQARPAGPDTTLSGLPAQIAERDSLIFEGGPLEAEAVTIERSLRCNCGCGLDVHTCLFAMQCGTSPKWAERIRLELRAGRTPKQIEAGFVADFGESVLIAPPAHGFNLVGYLLPGFGILMIGTLLGMLLHRGARPTEVAASAPDFADADLDRLREAMRRMDESERPDW